MPAGENHKDGRPAATRTVSENKSGRSELVWLVVCLVSVHASMTSARVLASLWALHEGHGAWVAGILLGLFSLGPLTMALWAGRLADRKGFHLPVRIGAGLAFGCAVLAFTFRRVEVLGACALVLGAATCIGEIATQRRAGHLASQGSNLKRVYGWIALSTAMSNMLAPVLVGFTIDMLGYDQAFMLVGLLPVSAWLASLRIAAVAVVAQSAVRSVLAGARALLGMRPLRRILIINFALAAGWDVHTFAVPVIGHERAYSASTIGLILGCCSMGAIAARALIARHAERLDEDRALATVMAVSLCTLIVYPLLPVPSAMMVASALLGLAIGSVQPLVLSALHKAAPADMYGQALGLRMVATNGATAGLPMLSGVLAAASSVMVPMWAAAGGIALAAVLLR